MLTQVAQQHESNLCKVGRQPLEHVQLHKYPKQRSAQLVQLAHRLELECGMSHAAGYIRNLAAGLTTVGLAPTTWLLATPKRRATPLQSTSNKHFNLLPDVCYWRLKVRMK